MKPIIEVNCVSKKYYIEHQRRRRLLGEELEEAAKRPLLWLKNRLGAGTKEQEEFWALKDITFSIQRGEIVGFIGKNGAGKSTLLKIISRIISPTEGEVRIRGTVGSLLELGAAFHSDLSGAENIYLAGAIYGLPRKAIADKFTEIVSFAGVEQFIDMPVKFYSSGMYIRLAFSVAVQLEPDILIIDEVLGVGDAEFQKRSFAKMGELVRSKKHTILTVSHNLTAIAELCTKVYLLEKGSIVCSGLPDRALNVYKSSFKNGKD